ncbi:MAG: hypothetical protein H7A23_25890 [Leptospiraceae bacterium]|nr:hypothetical protein [Leptospiraceae bacterium]
MAKKEEEKKLNLNGTQLSIPTAEANQNWKLFASLHREKPWFSKQVLCLRTIGSCLVTALALAKAHLLGDMPKRHVGYALTLDAI